MKLIQSGAEIYFPPGQEAQASETLSATTHLGIGAHQDDLEIMAIHGIVECYQKTSQSFTGVIVTDGAGSARSGAFVNYDDRQMQVIRREEQKRAAVLGAYGAQFLLNYPSLAIKTILDDFTGLEDATFISHDSAKYSLPAVGELFEILLATRPQVVYTHSLCDKHDTHVAVALCTLLALRKLPADMRPELVLGCEVWRDLDWLPDDRKFIMDVSSHPELQEGLLRVFESQVAGGKRYDLGALGRRRAHATFQQSHVVDESSGLVYGMDLTSLMDHGRFQPQRFVAQLLDSFKEEIARTWGAFSTQIDEK